jgi:hypothetical protein
MSNNPFNPFMMPNFGQGASESATNPLIASMEMMRHAMAGMSAQTPGDGSGNGMGAGLNFAQALNPEDIERRISELKVVENWLKLNLSMLTSTIQGLEVQLATIQTLKSFAAMGAQANEATQNMQKSWSENVGSDNVAGNAKGSTSGRASAAANSKHSNQPIDGQSPLEAVLGMQPSAQGAAQAQVQAQALAQAQAHAHALAQAEQARQLAQDTAARSAASEPLNSPGVGASKGKANDSSQNDATTTQAAAIPPAGQAWWNMLEKQFSQIAVATQEAAQVANDAATKAANETAAKFAASTEQQAKAKPATKPKTKPKPAATKPKAAPKAASKTTAKAPAKPAVTKRPAKPRAND